MPTSSTATIVATMMARLRRLIREGGLAEDASGRGRRYRPRRGNWCACNEAGIHLGRFGAESCAERQARSWVGSSSGASAHRSPDQSAALTTSSTSHHLAVPRVRDRRDRDPGLERARDVHGASSTSRSMPISRQRATLS